jgi:hypothetical protein
MRDGERWEEKIMKKIFEFIDAIIGLASISAGGAILMWMQIQDAKRNG